MNGPFVIEQATNLVNRAEFQMGRPHGTRSRCACFTNSRVSARTKTAEEIALAHQFTQSQKAVTPPAAGAENWVFGYGSFDDNSKRVKKFRKLALLRRPCFSRRGHDAGPAKLGLGDAHRQPAAIRAMTNNTRPSAAGSRRALCATITIQGTLEHGSEEQGDGVRGADCFQSNPASLVNGSCTTENRKPSVEHTAVKQGDTIDFVTDCNGTVYYDSFGWAPAIRYVADGKTVAGQRMDWKASEDFLEAARATNPAMDAWQKYAQILLLANELVFVD